MSTTQITQIPYGGGTLNLAQQKEVTTVYMGNNKFVNLYAQSNPNIVYAHVVTVSGLSGGTASSTTGPQFAFAASAGRVRAWKVAANRLFVLMGNDLRVLETDASDNIVMKNAVLTNYVGVPLWRGANGSNTASTEMLADAHQGAGFTGHRAADNAMYFVMKIDTTNYMTFGNSTSNSGLSFVAYDPQTDAFTSSERIVAFTGTNYPMGTFTAANGVDGMAHVRFADIPNSPNKLMYMVGAASSTINTTRTGANTPRLFWANVLSPSGSVLKHISMTGNPTTNYSSETPYITAILPLGDDKFVGFTDSKSFLYHDGNQWLSNRVIFATSGTEAVVTGAYTIDGTYCAITFSAPVDGAVSGSARASKNAIAQNQYLRIVRIVDGSFAEVSPATENYANFSLGVPLNIEGNFIEKIGPNTLAYYTKANGTVTDPRINIRSIFGA